MPSASKAKEDITSAELSSVPGTSKAYDIIEELEIKKNIRKPNYYNIGELENLPNYNPINEGLNYHAPLTQKIKM